MVAYEFEYFSLDVTDGCLKENGRLLIVPDKLLHVLLLLVENHHRVVSKEELMLKVWANTAVEDSNLTVSISRIRKLLRESEQRKFILTFPRRGYRFIATVRRTENNGTQTAMLAHADQSLALMNVDCASDLQAQFRDESDYFQAPLLFSNESSRSRSIFRSPRSDEAYSHYVAGRRWWSMHHKKSLERAIEHLQRALELDPYHLPVYSDLVDCYLRLATNYHLPRRRSRRSTNNLVIASNDFSIKSDPAFQLKEAWEGASALRERNRAHQLGLKYPSADQWYAAYLFACAAYRDAFKRLKTGTERTHPETQQDAELARIDTFTKTCLAPNELLQISCVIARNQIEIGNIEGAYLAINHWYEIGQWPKVDGLSVESSADLLFTAGRLAGRLANSRRLPRGQIHAVSLLNGALSLFAQSGLKGLVGECRSELGRCYDRQGLFELARANFMTGLEELRPDDTEWRSRTRLRLAFSEMRSGRLQDSLTILEECKEMALAKPSSALFFHIEMATTAGQLAIAELSDQYFNLSGEHYREAVAQSAAVGHHHRLAVLENNHGYLLLAFGRLEEAKSHLFRARELFDHLRHHCPELDETIARLHVAKGQLDLAEKAICRSVATLESYGEAVLAESLRTQGRILARAGRYREARRVLDRAFHVAKECNDTEGAGLALLIVLEEISEYLECDERLELATTLSSMLCTSQRTSVLKRVQKCIEVVWC